MSDTYSAFVDDFHSHMTRDPNDCVLLGVEKRLDDLPDPSLEQLDDEIVEARADAGMAAKLAPLTCGKSDELRETFVKLFVANASAEGLEEFLKLLGHGFFVFGVTFVLDIQPDN